jgi:hypothetical protein
MLDLQDFEAIVTVLDQAGLAAPEPEISYDTGVEDEYTPIRTFLTSLYGAGNHSEEEILPEVANPQETTEDETATIKLARQHVLAGARQPDRTSSCKDDLSAVPDTYKGPKLWPHQRAAIGRMLIALNTLNAALLAFEMGLGK